MTSYVSFGHISYCKSRVEWSGMLCFFYEKYGIRSISDSFQQQPGTHTLVSSSSKAINYRLCNSEQDLKDAQDLLMWGHWFNTWCQICNRSFSCLYCGLLKDFTHHSDCLIVPMPLPKGMRSILEFQHSHAKARFPLFGPNRLGLLIFRCKSLPVFILNKMYYSCCLST